MPSCLRDASSIVAGLVLLNDKGFEASLFSSEYIGMVSLLTQQFLQRVPRIILSSGLVIVIVNSGSGTVLGGYRVWHL
jgi:hypothetical protein